ncbi:hypothetical protein BKA56DRAFT_564980 [Ilyonectria sp. MPI-CAGE-AT-0026]|nr:hypothetical protein BKA56DRAFT_564980 [Ilyonectria sp. MPI-CAGE-AT-0026]
MALIRPSNAERRQGRDECRQQLSNRIQVRLNPHSNNRILGERGVFLSKIFAKILSDHSIGIYRLLCREVGKTFEAALQQLSRTELGFSAITDQLRDENMRLSRQVRELISQADADSEQRQLVEENRRLYSNQQYI